MDSILDSIKKLLGIQPEYTSFDDDIIMHINSVFVILNQLNIGPPEGFFIVDKSYNADNHGPELTERVALTLDVIDRKEAPKGIKYEGRQRFDINVASWRGIAYVYIGTPTKTESDWNYENKFTEIKEKIYGKQQKQ